jgi:hypothetical protein
MIRASTAMSTSPRTTRRRVTSPCETPRFSRAALVSATMNPAMKKKPGATGTPVKRVRNCARLPAAGAAAAASSSPPRPALNMSDA